MYNEEKGNELKDICRLPRITECTAFGCKTSFIDWNNRIINIAIDNPKALLVTLLKQKKWKNLQIDSIIVNVATEDHHQDCYQKLV